MHSNEIADAIQSRYPNLSRHQAAEAAEDLLSRAAAKIGEGATIGDIGLLPNGDVELSAYRVVGTDDLRL